MVWWFDFLKYGVKNDAFSPFKNENFGGWKVRIAIFEDKMVFLYKKVQSFKKKQKDPPWKITFLFSKQELQFFGIKW